MDLESILPLIIGSSVVASVIAGAINWIATRKRMREERVWERIEKYYIAEGLHSVLEAISRYGTALTLSIADTRKYVVRYRSKEIDRDELIASINLIRERDDVRRLIDKSFGAELTALPRMQIFGMELYNAILQTFYVFSNWTTDILDIDRMSKEMTVDIEAYIQGIIAVFKILQDCKIYLERRLGEFENYLLLKEYFDYKDFINLKDDSKVLSFNSQLDSYKIKLNVWMNSMGDKKMRAEKSMELSKWLFEIQSVNPFERTLS